MDDDGGSASKRFKKSDDGGNQNRNGKNKRFSTGLKNKDQILKERRRKEKVQSFQNRKKGGKKGGKSGGKRSFKSKK